MDYIGYALIGMAAGILSGIIGIGGGILIIPALVLAFGYDQLRAQGTSLAVLLPPIGALGFWQYWKNPDVQIDLWAVVAIAGMFLIGGHYGGKWANSLDAGVMRKFFAVFLACVSVYLFIKR